MRLPLYDLLTYLIELCKFNHSLCLVDNPINCLRKVYEDVIRVIHSEYYKQHVNDYLLQTKVRCFNISSKHGEKPKPKSNNPYHSCMEVWKYSLLPRTFQLIFQKNLFILWYVYVFQVCKFVQIENEFMEMLLIYASVDCFCLTVFSYPIFWQWLPLSLPRCCSSTRSWYRTCSRLFNQVRSHYGFQFYSISPGSWTNLKIFIFSSSASDSLQKWEYFFFQNKINLSFTKRQLNWLKILGARYVCNIFDWAWIWVWNEL